MLSRARWDLFISHASEDKEAVVRPLALLLSGLGVRVWYDEFASHPGDSLSKSIDRGLARSRYGLLVLSPSFFAKSWPEYELRGLVALEVAKQAKLIPAWYGVTKRDVLRFSPPLADKVAVQLEPEHLKKVCLAIVGIVRPKLLQEVHRRMMRAQILAKIQQNSRMEYVDPTRFRLPPIRHERLPDDLLRRIRLIRAALLPVNPHSFRYWVDARSCPVKWCNSATGAFPVGYAAGTSRLSCSAASLGR